MPIIDSENVTNTLIEYMMTSVWTLPCVYIKRAERGKSHQQDAVVRGQPLGEVGEPARHPGVVGHVGQHARPVDEAGLRGDKQQRAFRKQRGQARTRCPASRPPSGVSPINVSART